jgi:UDP-glucose 4-epimerase
MGRSQWVIEIDLGETVMNPIVVTGAAGYIGGQIVLALLDAGHEVLGIDSQPLTPGKRAIASDRYEFLLADFASDTALKRIVVAQPKAVIHCGGTSLVGPSVKDPSSYYENNVIKTKILMDIIRQALPRTRFIFSSSAAVYGEPMMNPCYEVDVAQPISPYGESKYMTEMMLKSYHHAYGFNYVAFRYFNACGADPQQRNGQKSGATHVIARLLEAIRNNTTFYIYGKDYPTKDGTCVRDYVHVSDIARAHVLALDPVLVSGVYNLGSNNGTSVREIIDQTHSIIGQLPPIVEGHPRSGDPAVLTANSDKFSKVFPNWRTHSLTDMIRDAWNWYNV